MLQQVTIASNNDFVFQEFQKLLGMDDLVLSITPDDVPDAWGFYRKEKSNTLFIIEGSGDEYTLSMDCMASYDDYCLFPYLVDTLSTYLCDEPYEEEGVGAFKLFDEEWREDTIGEEIAYLKCMLSVGVKYYIELPISDDFPYVSESILHNFGVSINSSTPRIYGYVNYMLRHGLLLSNDERDEVELDDVYVDVPQHESIGIVHSWQTDGAVTTESYSQEDVDLLIELGNEYKQGKNVEGVVLNDIGTIYENGIGTERNAELAIYWYKEAMKQGDRIYAPTSLGDIYRRGLDTIKPDLNLALEAYRQSDDPYAWYRIGQSYEEGWTGETDMEQAMKWYQKAAAVGHHLALKRLDCEDEN